MGKINYIIACWSGKRRDCIVNKHPAYYLQKHIEMLSKFKHNISQITVVIPHNPKEPLEYRNYINHIKKRSIIKVIERENFGQSYGSYSAAFHKYRDFNYYIFIEDDWVFVQDNFDKKLIDFFNDANCGYLCGLTGMYRKDKVASISNGITTSKILNLIWDKFKCIPHGNTNKNPYSVSSQVQFSRAFTTVKKDICDITREYAVPFNAFGKLKIFNNKKDNFLMVPTQFLQTLGI